MNALTKPKFLSSNSNEWKNLFASLLTKQVSGIFEQGIINDVSVSTLKYALFISNFLAIDDPSDSKFDDKLRVKAGYIAFW